jgi:hypothetical protein
LSGGVYHVNSAQPANLLPQVRKMRVSGISLHQNKFLHVNLDWQEGSILTCHGKFLAFP